MAKTAEKKMEKAAQLKPDEAANSGVMD